MERKSKISVCMATYNGEIFIKEQIESILHQLEPNDEIIISDDGSSDGTLQIVNSFNDCRIKVFNHEKRTCYTANYENALSHSTGDIIFLADQDDIWLDNKVKLVLRYLETCDFVMSNAMVVNERKDVIIKSRNDYFKVKNGFFRNIVKTRYLGCCMAFKREILDFCLPFPENKTLCVHDAWLALASEMYFKTRVIDEPLILYRRYGNNASNGGNGSSSIKKMIKIRGYILAQLIKRKITYGKGKI